MDSGDRCIYVERERERERELFACFVPGDL